MSDIKDYSSFTLEDYDLDLSLYNDEWERLAIEKVGYSTYKAGRIVGINHFKTEDSSDEITLQINPRFLNLDPLKMLEELFKSEELSKHVFGVYDKNNPTKQQDLFKIFHHKPHVRTNKQGAGETLTAMTFISELYQLCKKQLKPQMTQIEENLYGKVKGRILFKQHIRQNVMKGQEHRIYSRYNLNTLDSIENRILKAALQKAKKIMEQSLTKFSHKSELSSYMIYCEHALRNVRKETITTRDFSAVRTTGFYAYYKPALSLARLIIEKAYINHNDQHDHNNNFSVVPYAIDMQLLFEMYVYSRLKECNDVLQNRFNQKYEIMNENLHLQRNVIPDFILMINGKTIILDAKYKHSSKQDRSDTLQILAYSQIFNADAVGFIFPWEEGKTHIKKAVQTYRLTDQNTTGPTYFELFLKMPNGDQDNIEEIIKFIEMEVY